jgi:hypothetical protein
VQARFASVEIAAFLANYAGLILRSGLVAASRRMMMSGNSWFETPRTGQRKCAAGDARLLTMS